MVALFALTLFLSSALLFLVQPMFAKMALPLLGGTPAVWNTCVVFFQTMLLLAYAYAHGSTRWLGVRRQAVLHLALLCVPLVVLPIGIREGWVPPTDQNPVPWLLLLLLASVGLPFFVVASNAPLLQKWFSASRHTAAGDPYFLYAASNAGSMLALLAYPFVVEPGLRLAQQSALWTGGYVALLALTAGAAAVFRRAPRQGTGEGGPEAAPSGSGGQREPVTARRRLRWVALAMVPSSLMLAVTSYLSTDIAAVPLLWIVPLTLYLLTFAIAFARAGRTCRLLAIDAMPVLLLVLAVILVVQVSQPLSLVMPVHVAVFFVIAMMCHGELARDRPAVRHLTEFYVWIAAGGWLGGMFNSVLAPLVFTQIAEYPLTLMLACMLRPALRARAGSLAGDVAFPMAAGLATLALLMTVGVSRPDFLIAALLLPALLCLSCAGRPLRFGLATGAMLFAGYVPGVGGDVVHAERTFFGVYRVIDRSGEYRSLVHGTTVHGRQSLDPDRRSEPLTYYHPTGPIGQVIAALSTPGRLQGVAVVGLGTGSLAAYAGPGQRWDFYEIDPAVEGISRTHFTYLDDCGHRCHVILGDARHSLATAARPYDLIILDAFSSDAIPVHLLTGEAVRMYLGRLAPQGVLAFHISNRHLNLTPVLSRLAGDLDLVALVQRDHVDADEVRIGKTNSEWLVMGPADTLAALAAGGRWRESPADPRVAPWTDEFSNIVAVLRTD